MSTAPFDIQAPAVEHDRRTLYTQRVSACDFGSVFAERHGAQWMRMFSVQQSCCISTTTAPFDMREHALERGRRSLSMEHVAPCHLACDDCPISQ